MFSGEFIRDFLAFFMQNKIKHARRPLHLAGREVRRHPLTLTDRVAGLMSALTNPRQEMKPPLYMPGLHRALALPDRARPPGCPGAAGMARGAMALPARCQPRCQARCHPRRQSRHGGPAPAGGSVATPGQSRRPGLPQPSAPCGFMLLNDQGEPASACPFPSLLTLGRKTRSAEPRTEKATAFVSV